MAVSHSGPLRNVLRELALTLAAVVGSLAILPGVIHVVGVKLFGPYQGGMREFYLNTLKDLLTPAWPAWVLALGPALCLLLVRWIWRTRTTDQSTSGAASGSPSPSNSRREPTL